MTDAFYQAVPREHSDLLTALEGSWQQLETVGHPPTMLRLHIAALRKVDRELQSLRAHIATMLARAERKLAEIEAEDQAVKLYTH